jgi:bacillithiol biosynthesis deacetylase BshB1
MADVVCFGAHPDDVEIGMGATVAGMVRRGLDVVICDLTDGEPTPAGDPETRAREARAAADALGVEERVVLPLRNRELVDDAASRGSVAELIREHHPAIVFSPFPEDAHPDHVACASIVEAARFWAKLTKTDMRGTPHYPPRLYRYYALHLRVSPDPSFVVDATDDMAAKLSALRSYESQFAANPANSGVVDRVELAARYWGGIIGSSYGEPFSAPEQIGVASIETLV